MKKALIVYNCHGYGMATCLAKLAPEHEFVSIAIEEFQQMPVEGQLKLVDQYDDVLALPHIMGSLDERHDLSKIHPVPDVAFDGYHPDICLISHGDKLITGAADEYHSMIVFAAANLGFPVSRVIELFNRGMYEKLGYFDRWGFSKLVIFHYFKKYGYDLSRVWPNWCHLDGFMITSNHPRIECVMDIARMTLDKLGYSWTDCAGQINDNLLTAGIYPIYPEIADRYGANGNYLFKSKTGYKWVGLEEFIEASYGMYDKLGLGSLEIYHQYADRYASVLDELERQG